MNIEKAYYYLFYKLYKFADWSPSIFPSDVVAILIIVYLELSTLASFKIYYKFFHRTDMMEIFSYQTLVPFSIVMFINYFAFLHTERWKDFNCEFKKWPRDKNLKGTLAVLGVIIIILTNNIFSLYLIGIINGYN